MRLCAGTLTLALGSSVLADDYSDALQLTRNGNDAQALARVEQALAKNPKDSRLRLLKALIQDRSGQNAESVLTLTRLIEEQPELPEPYNNLAVLYAAQNQYDQARNALEMAVRNDPGYAIAHENLGDVYVELARQSYLKAQQGNSGDATLQRKLSVLRDLAGSSPQKAPKP